MPKGWEWVRLGAVRLSITGAINADPKDIDNGLLGELDLEDIEKDNLSALYRAKILRERIKIDQIAIPSGRRLYGKLRPYLDKVIVANGDGVCTTEIVPIVHPRQSPRTFSVGY